MDWHAASLLAGARVVSAQDCSLSERLAPPNHMTASQMELVDMGEISGTMLALASYPVMYQGAGLSKVRPYSLRAFGIGGMFTLGASLLKGHFVTSCLCYEMPRSLGRAR